MEAEDIGSIIEKNDGQLHSAFLWSLWRWGHEEGWLKGEPYRRYFPLYIIGLRENDWMTCGV